MSRARKKSKQAEGSHAGAGEQVSDDEPGFLFLSGPALAHFNSFIADFTGSGLISDVDFAVLGFQLDTESSALHSRLLFEDAKVELNTYFLKPPPFSGGAQPEGEHLQLSAEKYFSEMKVSSKVAYSVMKGVIDAGLERFVVGPIKLKLGQSWVMSQGTNGLNAMAKVSFEARL